VTPVLAIIACGYILFSLPWYTWLAFALWVSVALTFYFLWGRHHSALNQRAAQNAGSVPGVEIIDPPRDVP
jgi:membrane protein implicated in regulation of membrane protease activity